MTPAIDLEATANRLDSYAAEYSMQHHHHHQYHHKDTADLLMEAKEAQRIKTMEIMDARAELLRSKLQDDDAGSIATAVDSNSGSPEKVQEDFHDPCGPFEGPEKLLELWFAKNLPTSALVTGMTQMLVPTTSDSAPFPRLSGRPCSTLSSARSSA